jgi:Zn-dependent protease
MGDRPWWSILVWILAGFLSVLVHEFGHITAGRIFGYPGVIVLHMFGGGAIGEYLRAKPWQRIIIALAGPFAGALLFGLVYVSAPYVSSYLLQRTGAMTMPLFLLLGFLAFMGLFWTVFNLMPVLPQDGGMVMKDLIHIAIGRSGERLAYVISFLFAAGLVWYGWVSRGDASYTSMDWFFEVLFPRHLLAFRGKLDPTFAMVMYVILAIQSLFGIFRRNPPPEAPEGEAGA